MSFLRNFVQENVSKRELSEFMKKLIHLRWMEVTDKCFVFSNLYRCPLTSSEAKTSKHFPFDTFPSFISLLTAYA